MPSPKDSLTLLVTVFILFCILYRVLNVPVWVALAATFLPLDGDTDTVDVALLWPRNLRCDGVYVVCGGER